MRNYTQKLTVIIKWYNLIDDKGIKLIKVYFVNSPSSSSTLTGVYNSLNTNTSIHETWYSDVVSLWVVHRHVKYFVNNVLLVKIASQD